MKSLDTISYKNKLMLSLFSFGLLIIFGIGTLLVFILKKEHAQMQVITAQRLFQERHNHLVSFVGEIEGKLFALKSSRFFVDYVHDKNAKNLEMAEELFFDIANASPNIMQLRFIDMGGVERIRADRDSPRSLPHLVGSTKLQNKAQRYYFSQIMQAPRDTVWYSKIDLNVEHGEIEKPIKPVLRAGIPYYEKDTLQGILIVNIFMQEFLDKLVYSNEYDIYLVDKDDNVLVSNNPQYNWSRYIKPTQSQGDDFRLSDVKFDVPFYSDAIDFNNTEELRLLVRAKEDLFIQTLKEEFNYIVVLLILISIVSLPLAHLFSKYPARLEKELEEHNRYLMQKIDKAVESYKQNEKMLLHQHRLAQLGEMIAMITHQWRQPLSTIAALVTGLKIKLELEDSYNKEHLKESLSSIEMQTTNLNQIIVDFKDFYSQNSPMSETSIDAVIASSLEIVSAQLKVKDISIDTDLNDKTIFSLYANHLKQAVISILQNAQEAFDVHNDDEKVIKVRTFSNEDLHIIEISDNAGGIPEEILESVFVPYFSTKLSKHGTGLGLYMTKMIIEQHFKGEISVRNTQEGAVFTISI